MARHPALLLLVLELSAGVASAATPPFRRYTTADGLPTNTVTSLHADSRGFLWVGTDDGLARFDGDRFEVFDGRDGLPEGPVNAILEHPDGALYVASDRGVVRLGDGGRGARFEPLPAPSAVADHADDLALGADDALIAATHGGLFRLRQEPDLRWEPIPLNLPGVTDHRGCTFVRVDSRGALWSGCGRWLVRIAPDGRGTTWDIQARLETPIGDMWIMDVQEDRRGRIWVAGSGFLWRLAGDPSPGQDPVARDYSGCPGGGLRMFALLQRRDGTLWAATANGPALVRDNLPDEDCPLQFTHPGVKTSSHASRSLVEDDAGNLWAGESSHGLVRIPPRGFVFYEHRDGVPFLDVSGLAEGPRGELVAMAGGILLVLDGETFRPLEAALAEPITLGWGANQRMLLDGHRDFWLGTRQGLYRWQGVDDIRRLAQRSPDRAYGPAVIRVFGDSRGDLWIGTEEGAGGTLCRWARADGAVRCFGDDDGLPVVRVRSMAEDAAGQLWIGFRDGTLVRRRDGRFERIAPPAGPVPEEITALLADRDGPVWVAAPRRGLFRVDGPADESPRFTLYGREAGLSSLDLRCLVQDDDGRIYIGTGRGIDRLDPSTLHVHHFTAQEGLLNTSLVTAARTGDGTLWFGTGDGLARLAPQPDPAKRPPRVYLTGLRIAGESRTVSSRGAVRLHDLWLEPQQNNVEIEFTGIAHGAGERLGFQTWLVGAETGWSDPSPRRSISYAQLAPGNYRFRVRAVNADGLASDEEAGLSFQVAAPVWRRWWFLSLTAAGLLAVGITFHRQRTARLVELERIRTRIASDLHDEVGAGLSEIALMGEVWARQGPSDDGVPRRIAAASRRLVDSMSDIVWAINPDKDRVFSLSQRMRRFATGLARGAGIALRFESIGESEDRSLDGDTRREVLLAFQELVHNAVKHAACSRLDVRLEMEGADLVLRVSDDGVGFDAALPSEGSGLASVRRRVKRLGGDYRFESAPSAGTRVTLKVPLRRQTLPDQGGPLTAG